MNPTEFLQRAYVTPHAFSTTFKSKLKSKHSCTKWYKIQMSYKGTPPSKRVSAANYINAKIQLQKQPVTLKLLFHSIKNDHETTFNSM